MSSTRRKFRSLSKWAPALTVLMLAGPAADAAFARNLTLTVTPDLPTWADSVRLRVAGEAENICGPSDILLANVRKPTILGSQLVVEVDLVEQSCPFPSTTPEPFVVEVDLGHLLPGSTTVLVHDLADGSTAQQTVLVYNVSRLGLDVPAAASSAAPVKVGVTYFDDCSQIEPEVAGNVITLTYSDGCNITPLPPQLTRSEVEVGILPAGDYEVRLVEPFASALRRLPLRVWDAAGCVPDSGLCLHGGRFRVTAYWQTFDGHSGFANAAPIAGNDGSGLLWFFSADNAELTVKVLDACGVDGDWWVFLASASTVEYSVTVTDTKTGAQRYYNNLLGQVPELIADTDAFDCP